jgi:hypothetical protein
MTKEEKVLNSGTFYWFKSQRRGNVAVPLCYLNDGQKKTLCSGLVSNRYELCNPYQIFTAHYMWLDKNIPKYLLVTDIELSPEIKRKLSPNKPVGDKFSFKITLSNVKSLLNGLKNGEVDERYVEGILTDTPWKPWVEKEWKLKRDVIIKDYCEHCRNQEKLVLQHTIQPRKINAILYELVGDRQEEFQIFVGRNRNSIELSFSENIQKVPVCPKCGSSQVHLRIRGTHKGTYVCNKTKDYLVCKNEFAKPDYGYDEIDTKEAEKRRLSLLRDKFCEKEGLLRIAAEKSLEEIITYLNFDHTKTLCNKCAYAEDRPFDKYWTGTL